MPKVFDERLPLLAATPFRIGALVFLVYVIGAMAQLIVGHFVDRYPLRTVFLPLSLIQGPCLLLAAWAQEWAMLLLAVGMMFGIFGQVTINDAMVARYTNEAWRGGAYAFRYVMSFRRAPARAPGAILHERTGGFASTSWCWRLSARWSSWARFCSRIGRRNSVLPVRAQAAE